MDVWTNPAGLKDGVLFRPVGKTDKVQSTDFTAKVIWSIVRKAGADCGFGTVAPHDVRRTCAHLCHQAGGELEQIQFLLVTCLSKPRNVTWGASNGSRMPSTTGSGWSRIHHDRRYSTLCDF